MKLILLINVKMPTIVGIITFISKINTTRDSFKKRKIGRVWHFRVKDKGRLFRATLSVKRVHANLYDHILSVTVLNIKRKAVDS